jgi:hypothetical protein
VCFRFRLAGYFPNLPTAAGLYLLSVLFGCPHSDGLRKRYRIPAEHDRDR